MFVLKIVQIIVAVLLMLAVLLQNKGSAVSGVFGGGGGNVTVNVAEHWTLLPPAPVAVPV